MNLIKLYFVGLGVCLALVLAGCSTPKLYHEADQNISNVEQQIANTQMAGGSPIVKRPSQPAIPDPNSISNKALPAWGQSQITIKARNLPMNNMVEKVLSRTGAMADYQADVNQSTPVSISYTGTVKGALERIAAATNYDYAYEGNSIVWTGLVTKTYDISFMPGVSQYQVGRASGAGSNLKSGEGSSMGFTENSSQYSNMQGNLSVWQDLTSTLEQLKSKDGKVFVSQATTTVTVSDHPQNLRTIASYLKQLNKELSREVALDVQVLQVNLTDAYEYGINWNLVRAFAARNTQFGISGGLAQSINLEPLNSSGQNGFLMQGAPDMNGNFLNSVIIKALSQQGKVSVITQPRTVTLNNQVAELSINSQKSYIRQVAVTLPATTGTGATTSLTPGVISTGFNLYILPKIQGDKVYLQISSTLANLVQLPQKDFKDQSGNVTASIQLPEIDEKRFNQRTLVPNSATLVVAGFKELRSTANKQQLFGQQALGGHGAEKNNSEIILLITPTILGNNN